ncbi:hypothetical protein [[Mycoplasma] gypis]|uniref:hypothetical protein n=1 Tax=[Mycoplasma] gypis TaxID=92404 RepID=UPI0019670B36|nr:hypothetical protein [[Mycoplasma] gypis]MBN0919685.1 hypothetical protein [[Mycoplasma] gypis]
MNITEILTTISTVAVAIIGAVFGGLIKFYQVKHETIKNEFKEINLKIDELNEIITSQKEQIEQLQNENKNLRDRVLELETENRNLLQKVKSLQEKEQKEGQETKEETPEE